MKTNTETWILSDSDDIWGDVEEYPTRDDGGNVSPAPSKRCVTFADPGEKWGCSTWSPDQRLAELEELWRRYLSAQKTIDGAGFTDNYTDAARARRDQALVIAEARALFAVRERGGE